MPDLTASQAQATIERLKADVEYWKGQADAGVAAWRDRIMRDAVRRYETGPHTTVWVVATRRLPDSGGDDGARGLLHHRDPTVPPRIVPPTSGQRGRYLTGEIRDAGPGSHIGAALCGMPLMADELWIKADHLIKTSSDAVLCGPCSYWAGTPTLQAAREAIR